MSEHSLPPKLHAARHEVRDMAPRTIAAGLLATLAVLALLAFLARVMFPGSAPDRTLPSPLPAYPAPALQAAPAADWQRFHAEQLRQLEGSYWIDAKHTIAHIPIDQAMAQVARAGIADWPKGAP